MFNSDCPFCEIRRGMRYQQWINPGIMRFEPLNPVTEGHMLFVPEQHYTHNAPDGSLWTGRAMEAAQEWGGRHLADSFNLITSFGPDSTQTVDHLHIHFVPRRPGDGLQLPWGLPHDRAL